MRICVNTRLLLPGKLEGIGWFCSETLKRITRQHPEHEFIFIFDRKYSPEFIFSENIKPVIAFPQSRHPLLWYLFFEWGVPPVLKKNKPDLFLSPDGWLSLRTDIPSLPVIHDLNFFHNPEWVSMLPRQYYNYFFPRFISKAKRIATVSEYSKKDISSRFHYPAELIDVVYNGVNEELMPISEDEIRAVRKKYSGGAPYFLFLSLVHPRKNLTRIIEAYNAFCTGTDDKIPLLVVGSTKYWTDDTRKAYDTSRYRDRIVFLGRLSNDELKMVLGGSLALVYASLFEGFGIPILEAMRCHVPVITSVTTSMPEVGGNAVCYVDPYDVDSIAEAMKKIHSDVTFRMALINKGIHQSELFTWQRTADRLWDSIVKAVNV
jgi:glycosyltransferase involved in cell wall biosynthesis